MPRPTASPRGIRVLAALSALACIALGLGLQLLDRSFAVDALGSVLYVVLIGLILVLIRPTARSLVIAAIAFAVAASVELLQLTGVPGAIVEVVPLARLVLGSAFDPLDLVAYAIGAAGVAALHQSITRRRRRPEAARDQLAEPRDPAR